MVDSWYCPDRVVPGPERISQVWRRSEVRNHKQRSLNTRLSSGTSANTSCRSRNAPGRMIRSDLFWYGNNLKMKPTYRQKNLLDYLFGGFRSTLKGKLPGAAGLSPTHSPWFLVLVCPPAPMNHVKYLRASPAEMPFRNWYTANTNHFHLTDSVRCKWKTQPDWVIKLVTHDLVRRIRFWRIKISGTWF